MSKRIKSYFECVCGVKAMPLTDKTKCRCSDIYLQRWYALPEGRVELLAERRRLNKDCPGWRKTLLEVPK